jgi:hypothetical protein
MDARRVQPLRRCLAKIFQVLQLIIHQASLRRPNGAVGIVTRQA